MGVVVILGMIALAILLTRREQTPDAKRVAAMEAQLNEVSEQVADFMLNDE